MTKTPRFDVTAGPEAVEMTARRGPEWYLGAAVAVAGLLLGPLAKITGSAIWGLAPFWLVAFSWALVVAHARSWDATMIASRRSLRAGLREVPAPGYRRPAVERFLEVDGREMPADAVQAVQVRQVGLFPAAFTNALFLVLADEVVLVEHGARQEELAQVAGRLREALGLPAASDPTGPMIALDGQWLRILAYFALAGFVALPLVMVAEALGGATDGVLPAYGCGLFMFGFGGAGTSFVVAAQRRSIRRSVVPALRSPSSALVRPLPSASGVLSVTQSADGLQLAAVPGRRWLMLSRRAPILVATAGLLLILVDERAAFLAPLALFLTILVRWALDRNDRPGTVHIGAGMGGDGEGRAGFHADGRRWPATAVRQVVVGAIPHPRLSLGFPAYVVLAGDAVEVAVLGDATTALELAGLLRKAMGLPAVTDDRPRAIPHAWRVLTLHLAYGLALGLGASAGLVAAVPSPRVGPILPAAVALLLLAFDRIGSALRARIARTVRRAVSSECGGAS